MSITDQSQLRDFISQRVDYENNPQSFRYQLEREINNHLKKEREMLKQRQIKMRNQKIQKDEVDRRRRLEEEIASKSMKGSQQKIKLIEQRVKSMSELRKRKEEFAAEKIKENRKEILKNSLEKIKKIEKERQDSQMKRLMKTESDSRLNQSLHISRLEKRNQNQDAEYEALVQKLHSKGIFSQSNPNHKALSILYTQKAKHVRSQAFEQQEDKSNILYAKLEKIEEARKRKDAMLKQKSEMLKREEKYQRQLKLSKLKELSLSEKKKNKKISVRDAMKLLFVQQLKEAEEDKIYIKSRLETPSFQQASHHPKIKQSRSFKEQIRRQIEIYKQKHG